jgi:DNA-binding MurR/RpiR family transcriptional regulator
MQENKILSDLKTTLEKVKRDLANKEGVRDATLARLKAEFGVNNIDEARAKLAKLDKEAAEKQKLRDELLKTATEMLEAYK